MKAATVITLSSEERDELEGRVRFRRSEQRVAERARIVLLAAKGLTNIELADKPTTVADALVLKNW